MLGFLPRFAIAPRTAALWGAQQPCRSELQCAPGPGLPRWACHSGAAAGLCPMNPPHSSRAAPACRRGTGPCSAHTPRAGGSDSSRRTAVTVMVPLLSSPSFPGRQDKPPASWAQPAPLFSLAADGPAGPGPSRSDNPKCYCFKQMKSLSVQPAARLRTPGPAALPSGKSRDPRAR